MSSCREFQLPAMRYCCATGVYMQYRDWFEAGEIPVDRPTELYPCDTYALYPAACYRYMMTTIQGGFDYRSDRIIDACLALPDRQRWGCFHGLGMAFQQLIMDWVVDEPGIFGEVCVHGTLIDQTMCVEGVIEKMADFDEGLAHVACDTLSVELGEICRSAADEKMYRMSKPSLRYYVSDDEFTR